LERRHGRQEFDRSEIVTEVLASDSTFAEATIRTHVTSRMCVDAPDHHASVFPAPERVARAGFEPSTFGL